MVLSPIVYSLGFTTASNKASPLEMLEEDLQEEGTSSSNILSKLQVDTIAIAATAPLREMNPDTTYDNNVSKRRRSSSGTTKEETTEINKKEKPSGIVRSLSSLTILGSKKSSKEESKSRPRGRSISSIQLSEVNIFKVFLVGI